ncbi:HGxxPAAW family protein [Tessaracoccus sp. G1721]
MARTPKHYHHGKSPAAWAGSVTAAVGSVITAGGAMLGPNWALVIFGAALLLIAGLGTMVMKAMGYGQP